MVGSDKNTEQNQAFNFPLTLKIISQINSIILLLLEEIFIKTTHYYDGILYTFLFIYRCKKCSHEC